MAERLLLADDLTFYVDGSELAPPPPQIFIPGSEIPYRDPRYVGRVLTVAADGSLVWVRNEGLPVSDARQAGAQLIVSGNGIPEWSYASTGPGGLTDDEVIASDSAGIGILYYGTTPPLDAFDGALWFATRLASAPPAPTVPTTAPVLSAASVSVLKATLSWTASTGATAYEIHVDGTTVAQVSGLSWSGTFSESTSHAAFIVPLNAGGPGPASNTVNFSIANQAPPPATGLDDTSVVRASFSVAWQYASPPADFSTWVVTTSAGTLSVNQGARTATITGAPDSTNVTVTVRAQDTGGLQSSTVSLVVRTPDAPAPAAPPTPGSLRVTRIGYSSADFAWNASSGATSYEWSGDGVNYSNIGTALTRTWSGLAESHAYKLYVRAVNAGGHSASASVSLTTLPKVNHYVYNTRLRTFGYGNEQWNIPGVGHSASGILTSVDNWANQSNANNWLFAVDYNLNTGPYSTQAYRWINFSFTMNFIDVEQVWMNWGYPGTGEWQAYDTDGTLIQRGRTASATWPLWVTANVTNAPTNKRIAKIQMLFFGGVGSPGYYKLREWAMQVRECTSTTAVLNPA